MFHCKLVNDPFGDPAAYIEFIYRREAILFDLGEIYPLPPRKILKLSNIFISHTHMDHFIGFDHLLRICLGRDQHINLFGPPGLICSIENKLAAYSWNLVENYTNDFVVHAMEIDQDGMITGCKFRCQNAFRPEMEENGKQSGFLLYESDQYETKCVFLDHKIPCLAFCLEEKKRVNIMKNMLQAMGLPVGPWLTELKNAILRGEPDGMPVQVWWREKGLRVDGEILSLGELKQKAVKLTPGEKIAYITDAIYHDGNIERMIAIAREADHLLIEACFLESDSLRAKDKYHLTAAQAGFLAREANVKRITLFHFSPKYQGNKDLLMKEAMQAFKASPDP